MLLPEAQFENAQRCVRRIAMACALAVPLAACGTASSFQPLHGPTASGQNLSAELATIDIAPIPGRVGQRIRNELIFQRDRGGESIANSGRRLDIVLKTVIQTMIDRTGNSGSQIYQLEATYRLVDTKT